MNNKYFVILVIILIVAGIILLYPENKETVGKLDGFARCLADKKIAMYGADWCPHCQNEKKAFGDSFQLVPYVECPREPQRCLAAGIEGYPTWIFPDGRKLEGEQGIEKLAAESGCFLE